MPKPGYFTQLNRHALFSRLASLGVLLAGLIGFVLYFEPSLAGMDSETPGVYQGAIVLLVMGMVLTSAGIAFLYISSRWPGELKKTVTHTLPIKMMVKLEVEQDSDSITYYAVISTRSIESGKTVAWRAHIWVYPPQIREDLGGQFECDVFLHPKTGLPAAIEYSRGVLWVMAGNGAVKRLPDRGSLDG
jgi:hypothetical protein